MSLYSLNLKVSGLISTVNKTIQKYSALELVPFSTKVYETTSIANNLIFDCGNVQKRTFSVNLIENISSIKFINVIAKGRAPKGSPLFVPLIEKGEGLSGHDRRGQLGLSLDQDVLVVSVGFLARFDGGIDAGLDAADALHQRILLLPKGLASLGQSLLLRLR